MNTKIDPYSPEGLKKGKQYAWMTAIGVFMLAMVNVGMGMMSFSLFYRVLLETYQATASQISLFYSIEALICGILALFIGYYVEKLPFKLVCLIGVLATAAELLLIAYGTGLATLYIAGFLAGVGQGFGGFSVLLGIVPRWFVKNRAIATNISTMGVSLASAVLSPILATIITNQGYQVGGLTAAIFTLVVGLTATIFFVRRSPEEHGLVPVGAEKPTDDAVLKEAPVAEGMPQKEVMRTSRFWILIISVSVLFGFASQGISPQLSNIMALRGFDLIQVGYFNSIRSILGIVISFVTAYFIDRNFRNTFIAMCFSFIAALVVLMFAGGSFAMMVVYAVLVTVAGPCSSSWPAMAMSNMYGRKAISGLQGINNTFSNIGCTIGPIVIPLIYAASSYETAMVALIPVILVALVGGLYATQKKYILFPAPQKAKKVKETAVEA